MASKSESDNTSSSTNDQSDGETQGSLGSNCQEEEEIDLDSKSNVANILKRLQSTGAVVKQPNKQYRCFTCEIDFSIWPELENHLIQHVSMPSVVIKKLLSDDEDSAQSGDENWSDEEDILPQQTTKVTPQKIDISQILNKTGISIKKSNESDNNTSNTALDKLSGLGFTIKKNLVTIKKENEAEDDGNNDVMKKLGQLGGIKLKLKSEGNNSNSFKVINGLKDFKASDDEDESGNDECQDDQNDDEEIEKSGELEGSLDSDDESISNKKNDSSLKNFQNMTVKSEPTKNSTALNSNVSVLEAAASKLPGRPAVKQTPKRGTNLPTTVRQLPQQAQEITTASPSSPIRRQSNDMAAKINNVVVKEEVDTGETQASNIPLFSGQIKSERTSPTPQLNDPHNTPALATVKSEPDAPTPTEPQAPTDAVPMLPIAKEENTGVTVIEINGDSNDEDDDCCVVSATPAPDIKPVIPKIETVSTPYPAPTYPSPSQSSYTPTIRAPSTPSTEKQHNFNWNAPDTKPPLDMLEKSADDIFESLLSSSTKKDNMSISDASEYISLDTLGPQHTCEVCNTRFTDLSLLEEHRRFTGHSKSIITPTSSSILPFRQTTNILQSLLPVKALAEQVGKLSNIGNSGPGFTHQQNVMINIQAYPGAGGVIVPAQPYNAYPPVSGQNMHAGYAANANQMFSTPEQGIPGQYPGQHYVGQQGYNQFQPPMSKPSGYPGVQNTFPTVSVPYSAASPLQSMQQAYGANSPNMMNAQSTIGQMGPPGTSPSQYVPTSSPSGTMKPPAPGGTVKIHNVQTFTTGLLPGQSVAPGQDAPNQIVGTQIPSSNQIRIAPGANVVGARPRMPAPVRNVRPSIRPGIQVHGQVRGQKLGQRMPLKRPGGPVPGPGQKRRTDMLLPGKHDNEDCQVMSMQKQREGLPLIQSVQGAKDKFNLGSQISITKKTVNKEANAMANVLASRGISVKQKQKSRSPTPERPVPHIPNLGAGVSIKHTSKSSNFTIPEAKVGSGMTACKICKKMFMNLNSLEVHMTAAHPNHKIPIFKCDECPASYPKFLQLQHHRGVFHNVTGANRELGLPVVDLSQEENVKRLSNLGIHNFIPLANREQASGCFGIPVLSVLNMKNGMTSGLSALGADGLLSLGPLKSVINS